jgi:tRNA nucleotidyltransferase (CCA-adding enzyme)
MVPTRSGPVDVTRFRGGGGLREDLARRDFTINAVALEPDQEQFFDPFGGLEDLENGRLRAVGSATDRLREDPLRALRAARFVGELGLTVDPAVEAALPDVAPALAAVAAERLRAELERLLLSPRVDQGIALLHRTGLEAALLPDVPANCGPLVALLPTDLTLRWAAWLRGTQAERTLRRLRVSRSRVVDIVRVLALHPLDERVPARDGALRRAMSRAGEENIERLLCLREAEIEAGATPASSRDKLADLRAALERIHSAGALALVRTDLALDGSAVMALLDCEPGPRVGRALQHLTECVLDDPSCNTPDGLSRRLTLWRDGPGG